MNLHVFTCAVFPSEQIAREKMWIMFRSAEKFGIDLHMYGNGRTFPGYRMMCHDYQLEYLKTLPTDVTHVLYTEGWDAFFTAPLSEIVSKYQALGSPRMLIAAFHQLANVSDQERYKGCFDDSIRYRYPQVGGYIAEREYLIYALDRMMNTETGDNCFLHYDAWKEGWYRPVLDSECEIFQVGEWDCKVIDVHADVLPRLTNIHTGTLPCIWHLSGGYTDPETGKDARLIPWATKLGIIECPHKWVRRRDGRQCVHCETVEFGV